MPRMQVYLPDDLYDLVKARGLPASELLQKAVRAEVRRLDLLAETDRADNACCFSIRVASRDSRSALDRSPR